ncbi:MAG: NAD-dependent epimerase/dehydratase family protein [Bacteroidales bacterium]
MKTALIAGATGLVGSSLVKMLADSDQYNTIHVVARRPVESASEKIIMHIATQGTINQLVINEKIDHAFCALGTTIKKAKTKETFRKIDHDYVLDFAKKTFDFGAEKFLVVSSMGADTKSVFFYSRVKGEVEQALKQVQFKHLFIFRPSLLLGKRKEQRTGEEIAARLYRVLEPLFIGKLKKYKGIEAATVAKAMISVALHETAAERIYESDEIRNF